jgi:hydroxyacylglutathione hydrolase
MLLERIESKGLAHYSYLIGDQGEAVVIDPRRDCRVYVQTAIENGYHIRHILETHRNEDYVVGSIELARLTEAEVWHADSELDYHYGRPAEDGQIWKIGRLTLEALSTPGHTPGSMSYLLSDPEGTPWIVFTGDALFAGDIGRVDLPGKDRMNEMANLMYESLFNRLLTLDDGVIVCPAHGAGSVCGTSISQRSWTTIGLERNHNPRLEHRDRRRFISEIAEVLERPPYFRMMEKLNLEGPPILGSFPTPIPLSPEEFALRSRDAIVVDTRMELGYSAAHLPNSLSIWLDGLPSFAGWYLPYDKPILLLDESNDPSNAMSYLLRMGYDNVEGYLSGGMLSWHTAGFESASTKTVTVQDLCSKLDEKDKVYILDVRSDGELESDGEISGAHHIHVTQLPERYSEVPDDQSVYIFCGSGMRSMTAASFLQREGWRNVTVVLGGLSGWSSRTCPIELPGRLAHKLGR